VHGRAYRLRVGTVDLPVDDAWVHTPSGIVHGDVLVDADLGRVAVDLDAAEVEHETVGQRGIDTVAFVRRRQLGRRPGGGLPQRAVHALGQQARRPVGAPGHAAEAQRVVGIVAVENAPLCELDLV